MAKGPVGTMDTMGFITEPSVKIDRAMAYWFANRIDQCIIIRDVKSFQYVTVNNQDEKKGDEKFLAAVKENLTQYMLQIFDTASIEVWAKRNDPGDKVFTLVISGQVGQDNKIYDLARSVYVNGSTFKIIANARAESNDRTS